MLHVERVCLDGRATKFNKHALDDNGSNENDNEPLVVKEALENIQLISNLSRVYQVEDLHEHEHLENYSVVKHLLCWG